MSANQAAKSNVDTARKTETMSALGTPPNFGTKMSKGISNFILRSSDSYAGTPDRTSKSNFAQERPRPYNPFGRKPAFFTALPNGA